MNIKKIVRLDKELTSKTGKKFHPSYFVISDEINGKKVESLIRPVATAKMDIRTWETIFVSEVVFLPKNDKKEGK